MIIYQTQEDYDKFSQKMSEFFDVEYTSTTFEPLKLEGKCVSPTNKGVPHTQEIIEIIRLASTGENNGMFGRKHNDKAKKIMAESASKRFKGKSYEELYGAEKAKELKSKRSIDSKGKNNSGKNNPRFDKKEYLFFNVRTQVCIKCSRYDFYNTYKINKGGVSEMINHGVTYKDWKVL